MYNILISKDFQKNFNKLPKKIQERVRKIIEGLKTVLRGEALKGDLQDFFSIHFERNKYRLIYYKRDKTIEILMIQIGKRTDSFYDDFKKVLNRSHLDKTREEL